MGEYTGNKTSDTRCSSEEVIRETSQLTFSFPQQVQLKQTLTASQSTEIQKGAKGFIKRSYPDLPPIYRRRTRLHHVNHSFYQDHSAARLYSWMLFYRLGKGRA